MIDRDYEVGDILVLCEYDKFKESYTGREIVSEITYITSADHVSCAFSPSVLSPGYAVLSFKKEYVRNCARMRKSTLDVQI